MTKTLELHRIPDWPKLAWLAVVPRGTDRVTVFHGPCVETNGAWCVEAVWPGAFAEGDFDQSDVVVGSGLRVRGDQVIFVSSSDTLNRLHWYERDDSILVSNSLPALAAFADLSFVSDFDYVEALLTITNGLISYVREIPTNEAAIHLVYFNNLIAENEGLREIAKPLPAPDFKDFASYRDYLFETARRIGENASDDARKHRVVPLAAVSGGYDSPAAAVLARAAGTQKAVTIPKARRTRRHLLDLDDSGESVAKQLGMPCTTFDRYRRSYSGEDSIWAGMGNVGDINLTLFDYPTPLCLLFTGFAGDIVWGKKTERPEPLVRDYSAGTRFCECRLELGVFNCAPPYWGSQKELDILAVSNLPEMAPWTLGGDYDRPIPRRIVEEAGVRRDSFATKKRAASFNRRFGRPLSVDLRADFARFMEQRDEQAASGLREYLSLCLRAFEAVVVRRLPRALRFQCSTWISLPQPSLFFIWANERRKNRYLAGLRKISNQPSR